VTGAVSWDLRFFRRLSYVGFHTEVKKKCLIFDVDEQHSIHSLKLTH
jgi:hypothetical protein